MYQYGETYVCLLVWLKSAEIACNFPIFRFFTFDIGSIVFKQINGQSEPSMKWITPVFQDIFYPLYSHYINFHLIAKKIYLLKSRLPLHDLPLNITNIAPPFIDHNQQILITFSFNVNQKCIIYFCFHRILVRAVICRQTWFYKSCTIHNLLTLIDHWTWAAIKFIYFPLFFFNCLLFKIVRKNHIKLNITTCHCLNTTATSPLPERKIPFILIRS